MRIFWKTFLIGMLIALAYDVITLTIEKRELRKEVLRAEIRALKCENKAIEQRLTTK